MTKRKFHQSCKKSRYSAKTKTSRHSSNPGAIPPSPLTKLAESSEQYITNLSSVTLSPVEKIALGKGLNFVPTPPKPTRSILLSDITTFEKRMRTAYIMHRKRTTNHPFKPPSKWHPKTTPSNTLNNYLEATKAELAHIRLRNQKRNMTRLETSALRNLKNNPEIVIKPYDKGRGICILNQSDYLQVGYKHLDSQHYMELSQDITPTTISMVQNTLTRMFNQNYIDKDTLAYLDPLMDKGTCPTRFSFTENTQTVPNWATLCRPINYKRFLQPNGPNLRIHVTWGGSV